MTIKNKYNLKAGDIVYQIRNVNGESKEVTITKIIGNTCCHRHKNSNLEGSDSITSFIPIPINNWRERIENGRSQSRR